MSGPAPVHDGPVGDPPAVPADPPRDLPGVAVPRLVPRPEVRAARLLRRDEQPRRPLPDPAPQGPRPRARGPRSRRRPRPPDASCRSGRSSTAGHAGTSIDVARPTAGARNPWCRFQIVAIRRQGSTAVSSTSGGETAARGRSPRPKSPIDRSASRRRASAACRTLRLEHRPTMPGLLSGRLGGRRSAPPTTVRRSWRLASVRCVRSELAARRRGRSRPVGMAARRRAAGRGIGSAGRGGAPGRRPARTSSSREPIVRPSESRGAACRRARSTSSRWRRQPARRSVGTSGASSSRRPPVISRRRLLRASATAPRRRHRRRALLSAFATRRSCGHARAASRRKARNR